MIWAGTSINQSINVNQTFIKITISQKVLSYANAYLHSNSIINFIAHWNKARIIKSIFILTL